MQPNDVSEANSANGASAWQALILAGGKGQGLRPLTIHTPKPIIPIANRPYLLYQIELLKKVGITDITLSLSYPAGRIEDLLGDGSALGVNIRYAIENAPLGTAGAFRELLKKHRQVPTIVLNGDIFTNLNLKDVLTAHRELQAAATIVTATVENPSQYGLVVSDEDNRVTQFIEKPKAEQLTEKTGRRINAGVYVLEPRLGAQIPAEVKYDFESQLFPQLIAANEPVCALHHDGYWLDIGTPQRYLQAHHDLLAGRVKKLAPERPALPAWTGEGEAPRIDKASLVDPSATLKAGVEIINSVIGPNCLLEERSRVENSVLWANARVGQQAVIRQSLIGKSSIIGRGAVTENVVLGDKSTLTDYTTV